MRIREFVAADTATILAVNAASRPGVAPLDAEQVLRLQETGALILVAEDKASLGYLIAFEDGASYQGEEFLYFRRSLKHSFVYIDQIAVDPSSRRSGVARTLYAALFAMDRYTPLRFHCCEVNLSPPNPISLEFHRRMGFRQLAKMRMTDGREVALLVRS